MKSFLESGSPLSTVTYKKMGVSAGEEKSRKNIWKYFLEEREKAETHRNIIVQIEVRRIEVKEKILEAAQEKLLLTYKGIQQN